MGNGLCPECLSMDLVLVGYFDSSETRTSTRRIMCRCCGLARPADPQPEPFTPLSPSDSTRTAPRYPRAQITSHSCGDDLFACTVNVWLHRPLPPSRARRKLNSSPPSLHVRSKRYPSLQIALMVTSTRVPAWVATKATWLWFRVNSTIRHTPMAAFVGDQVPCLGSSRPQREESERHRDGQKLLP